MNFYNKNILIIGLGISGVSAARLCNKLGARVTINDLKDKEFLLESIEQLKGLNINYLLGCTPDSIIDKQDIIIISPGVPINLPYLLDAKKLGIPVIGEIELGYLFCDCPIIAITGTNGKTTTATLVGEMLKNAHYDTHVLGNIGVPFAEKVINFKKNDIVVLEVSSAQLESIDLFHPLISCITNMKPEHMNLYGTFENYVSAKKNIFKNQTFFDYCILNYDDQVCRKLAQLANAKILYFSRTQELDKGVFLKNGKIYISYNGIKEYICEIDKFKVMGMLESAMISIIIGFLMGISIEIIRESLYSFGGIEHRLEYVNMIKGVTYINDSKSTNPYSTIHALETIDNPIILISGGKDDKNSNFDELAKLLKHKVKLLITMGQTADKIIRSAYANGFTNVRKVYSMDEAVLLAYSEANENDYVLLSPACNSKDMFKSHKHRGSTFKNLVHKLEGYSIPSYPMPYERQSLTKV